MRDVGDGWLVLWLLLLGFAIGHGGAAWLLSAALTVVLVIVNRRRKAPPRRLPDPTREPLRPGDPYYRGSTQEFIDTTDRKLSE